MYTDKMALSLTGKIISYESSTTVTADKTKNKNNKSQNKAKVVLEVTVPELIGSDYILKQLIKSKSQLIIVMNEV